MPAPAWPSSPNASTERTDRRRHVLAIGRLWAGTVPGPVARHVSAGNRALRHAQAEEARRVVQAEPYDLARCVHPGAVIVSVLAMSHETSGFWRTQQLWRRVRPGRAEALAALAGGISRPLRPGRSPGTATAGQARRRRHPP